MKCGNKNVMYLRQKGMCGRFCLGWHLHIILHMLKYHLMQISQVKVGIL